MDISLTSRKLKKNCAILSIISFINIWPPSELKGQNFEAININSIVAVTSAIPYRHAKVTKIIGGPDKLVELEYCDDNTTGQGSLTQLQKVTAICDPREMPSGNSTPEIIKRLESAKVYNSQLEEIGSLQRVNASKWKENSLSAYLSPDDGSEPLVLDLKDPNILVVNDNAAASVVIMNAESALPSRPEG